VAALYSDINEELQRAQEGMLYHKKLVSMLEDLSAQRSVLAEKVQNLKAQFDKEDLDVKNLEGKNLSHIFYTILGNLDKKLEKEREEALAARLKYEQASLELEDIEKEIARLESEEAKNRDWERIYHKLYDEKKEQLIASGTKSGEEILNLSQKIIELKNYVKEIKEAIDAGQEVIRYLNSASDSLKSARSWGTWDLVGGGLLTDLAKHSHIDDAKASVSMAQRKLANFRSELADVKVKSNLSVEISDFAKFADFFFDGLLADWHVRSKIQNSLESVENTKDQVKRVLVKLNVMERESMDKIIKLEKEINNLILNS